MDVRQIGRVLLWFALLTRHFVSPVSADIEADPRISNGDFARCFHERNDKVYIPSNLGCVNFLTTLFIISHNLKLVYGVQASSSGGDINVKRQTMQQFQPIRIQVFYDPAINIT